MVVGFNEDEDMLKLLQRSFSMMLISVLLLGAQLSSAAENPKDFVQRISEQLTTRLVKERAAYKKDPQLLCRFYGLCQRGDGAVLSPSQR